MPDPTRAPGAVFLSYASQDAEAAKRICDALRSAGVEVWFDAEGGLEHGDEWDQKIRRQIKECVLFIAVISANTQAREEGYFRIEWELAAQRALGIASGVAFILPIVIDDTREPAALVPDRFRAVQWTRLPGGAVSPDVQARFLKLWSHRTGVLKDQSREPGARSGEQLVGATLDSARSEADHGRRQATPLRQPKPVWPWVVAAIIALPVLYLIFKPRRSPEEIARIVTEAQRLATAVTPPPAPAAAEFPADPDLAKAMALVETINSTLADHTLAEDIAKAVLARRPTDPETVMVNAYIANRFILRGFDVTDERHGAARRLCERALLLAPDHPEALHVLGQFLTFRRADLPRAVDLLRRAVALKPDRPRYYNSYIEALEYAYPDEAVRVGEAAVARFPTDAILHYRMALTYGFVRGDLDAYEKELDQTIANGPVATAFIRKAGMMLLVHRDPAAARQWLDRIPESFRLNDRTVFVRYLVASASGEVEDALRALNALPGFFVNDFGLWPKRMLMGDLQARKGQAEVARRDYEAALADIAREKQRNPDANFDRAEKWLLVGLGRSAESRAGANLTYGAVPRPVSLRGLSNTWFNAISTLLVLDERAKALELLREAVAEEWGRRIMAGTFAMDPHLAPWRDDPEIKALLAEPKKADPVAAATAGVPVAPPTPARGLAAKALVLLQGLEATREDFALAEDYCQRALKLDPTDGEVWAIYAQLHSAFGYRGWDTSAERKEQNRVMAERAIRLAPDSAQAKIAQAGAWTSFGINRAETEKLLREVVAAQPGNQPALRFLAVTLLNQGKLDECLALNERSAALPGGDPLALFNNSRYLWQRGRRPEAYAIMQRSLAQKPFSSSLTLMTIMEIGLRGDLAAAEATFNQIPQAMQLEDRANFTAGLLAYYQRRPEKALAAWGAFPRDYYMDFAYDGPKGLLVGLADEMDHRDAAAKIEWRTALQAVEKRIAATPNNPVPYYYQAYLLACLGDKAAAGEALRTSEQLAGIKYTPGSEMTFETALVYARLGRLDEIFAQSPDRYLGRLRIDPRFDALRVDPRYTKLLAEEERHSVDPKK